MGSFRRFNLAAPHVVSGQASGLSGGGSPHDSSSHDFQSHNSQAPNSPANYSTPNESYLSGRSADDPAGSIPGQPAAEISMRQPGAGFKVTVDPSLQQSFLEILTDTADCFLFVYSPRLKSLLSWSDNIQEILGVDSAALIRDANVFLRYVHPDDQFRVLETLERALQGDIPYRLTYRWVRPDTDQTRLLHCRAALISRPSSAGSAGEGGADNPLLEGVIFDLGESGADPISHDGISPHEILASLPAFVFILDSDLRVTYTNAHPEDPRSDSTGAAAMVAAQFDFGDARYRRDPSTPGLALGKPVLSGVSDEAIRTHYQEILLNILHGHLPSYHAKFFHRSSSLAADFLPLGDSQRPQGVLGVVWDAVEQANIERQLATLRKAEGMRSLAVGVSHHINNALQAIMGQATLIHTTPADRELVEKASSGIVELVRKASDLSAQLFTLDDPRRSALTPVDLNLAVMAAVSGVEEFFSSSVQLEVVFGNPAPILAIQPVLVEAIQDLLIVVRDRALASGTEELAIKTCTSKEAPQDALRQGLHSCIVISHHRSAHDLSDARSFLTPPRLRDGVEEFGGTFEVREEGQLINYWIEFPAGISSGESLTNLIPGELPQVLVIDDDPLVLHTVSALLSQDGLACAGALSGSRGLELARQFARSIKVVLLDAVLPGENDQILVGELRRFIPRVRVLGFSGASTEMTDRLLKAGAERIIHKPIDPTDLSGLIREMVKPIEFRAR